MRQLRLVPRLETNPRPRFMIHVERQIPPTYDRFLIKGPLYPGFECFGPVDFDLSLSKDRPLNLQDGLAIMGKKEIFCELFGETKPILLLSVSWSRNDSGLLVPRIYYDEEKREMKLEWRPFKLEWYSIFS